jgi:AraC-like DNA-binding protein
MPHAPNFLLDAILLLLRRAPYCALGELSLELRVSKRTIQKALYIAAGKTFRTLREEVLLERTRTILASYPTRAIKELSFDLGYKSPSSFARAIKRACGCSPEELRSRVIRDLLSCQRGGIILKSVSGPR